VKEKSSASVRDLGEEKTTIQRANFPFTKLEIVKYIENFINKIIAQAVTVPFFALSQCAPCRIGMARYSQIFLNDI